jgi:hypothetical protein
MKVAVDQNETPFERMKRQAFEWLEKRPTAPEIIHLALEKLESTEEKAPEDKPTDAKKEIKYYRCKICDCTIMTNENTPYWLPKAQAHQKARGEKLCKGKYIEISKEDYERQ